MVKVAPIIGQEMTKEMFFERFIELARSDVANIRKHCATVFAVMCEVLGNEVLEEHMIPLFVKLCEDTSWNIRNACAQIIPMISILCSLDLRRKYLVPIMKKFMFDDNRWVITSALNVSHLLISRFDSFFSKFSSSIFRVWANLWQHLLSLQSSASLTIIVLNFLSPTQPIKNFDNNVNQT